MLMQKKNRQIRAGSGEDAEILKAAGYEPVEAGNPDAGGPGADGTAAEEKPPGKKR